MANRKPTNAQLNLLRSIDDGNVVGEVGRDEIWEVGYIVTRRVRAMQRNGWCEPIVRGEFEDWVLTDAGRSLVAGVETARP